ncbi:hypothetical protein [Larkinella harenae]
MKDWTEVTVQIVNNLKNNVSFVVLWANISQDGRKTMVLVEDKLKKVPKPFRMLNNSQTVFTTGKTTEFDGKEQIPGRSLGISFRDESKGIEPKA